MLIEIFNLLHDLGIAFGLGGVTAAMIISRKAEKDSDLNQTAMKIMPSISKLIWWGLIFLIISGVGLTVYIKWPMNRQLLLLKHILVVWIVIIGIFIGMSVRKIQRLAKIRGNLDELIKAKRLMKTLSTINFILWYATTIISIFV